MSIATKLEELRSNLSTEMNGLGVLYRVEKQRCLIVGDTSHSLSVKPSGAEGLLLQKAISDIKVVKIKAIKTHIVALLAYLSELETT